MPGYELLILCGGAFLGLLIVIESLSERTNLNGIKGRTVGDGQHGSARVSHEKRAAYHLYPRALQPEGMAQRRKARQRNPPAGGDSPLLRKAGKKDFRTAGIRPMCIR